MEISANVKLEPINIKSNVELESVDIHSNVLDDVLRAKINGRNTLNIIAGENISLEQRDDTLIISTYGDFGSNYDKLTNKPRINDVVLQGNKISSDLNLQDKMDSLSNSDIEELLNNQI